MQFTNNTSDVKRSSILNLSKNTNQLQSPTIDYKKVEPLIQFTKKDRKGHFQMNVAKREIKEVPIKLAVRPAVLPGVLPGVRYPPSYSYPYSSPLPPPSPSPSILFAPIITETTDVQEPSNLNNNFLLLPLPLPLPLPRLAPLPPSKKMVLPFAPIITETTQVIIDSEPNSPKTYEYDLFDEKKIQPIVEKCLLQMIHEESHALLENEADDDDDLGEGPKTKFEEMIEPAVARIVQRIIKYDYAHEKHIFPGGETSSLNLDINYDEVYDYEMQEKGHFEAPPIEIKASLQPGMFNPMYNTPIENIPLREDAKILDIGSIYKMTTEDNKKFYDNELRSAAKSKWLRFGNGIETGSVIDMVLDKLHKKIYLVGHFKHVNRIPIQNVAVYDMRDKSWNPVGNGVPSVATCVAVYEEAQIVFVGGVFTKVGKGANQAFAHNIAAYYTLENKWIPLGEGLNRDCNTLVFDNKQEKLYAGGTFTCSGIQPMHYVGIYDLKTKTWTGLYGGETNGPCRTLMKTNNTDLYIGGLFTHAGNTDIHASYVVKYNLETQQWSDLAGGLQGYCNALAYDVSENVVYVGGTFNSVGNIESAKDAHHIAKYNIDEQTWDVLHGGVNNVVNSLNFDDVDQCLYVGGIFTHTYEDNILLNRIGKYTPLTNEWSSLSNHFENCMKTRDDDDGHDNVGLNGVCRVMNMDDKSLFIAGSFQIAGSITANSIVRYVVNRG